MCFSGSVLLERSSAEAASVLNPSKSLLSPVIATLSIHVEGRGECPLLLETGGVAPDRSACSQIKYDNHLADVRAMADLFVNDKAQLPLSLETEEPFLNAASAFREELGEARISALIRKGHSVGAHGDSYSYSGESAGGHDASAVKAHFSHLKQTLENPLVQKAQSSVHTVSGVCASVDWLKAVEELGFDTVGGIVSYCLRSLPTGSIPTSDIPGGGTDIEAACSNPSLCHATYPYVYYSSSEAKFNLSEGTTPWNMDSNLRFRGSSSVLSKSFWLASNPSGKVTSFGGIGSLYCLAEKKSAESKTSSETGCNFCQDDIDTYFEILDQAIAARTPFKPTVVASVYSLGSAVDAPITGCTDGTRARTRADLLKNFVSRMSAYVASGKVTWKRVPDVRALVR